MKINATDYNYGTQKTNRLKQIGHNAAISCALSTGLTLAVNKGKGIKQAAGVGLFAAAASVVIDKTIDLINVIKVKKEQSKEKKENN